MEAPLSDRGSRVELVLRVNIRMGDTCKELEDGLAGGEVKGYDNLNEEGVWRHGEYKRHLELLLVLHAVQKGRTWVICHHLVNLSSSDGLVSLGLHRRLSVRLLRSLSIRLLGRLSVGLLRSLLIVRVWEHIYWSMFIFY